MNIVRDRVIAAFLGTAIGDALGMPIEGLSLKKRRAFGRIDGYRSNPDHPWNGGVNAGQWTDDTQLTLVVAESLIASGGTINMDDMSARHVAALEEAQRDGLGWGRTTTLAVERLKAGVHWSESGKNLGEGCGAGNGIAMKMVPIGATFASWGFYNPDNLLRLAVMTHSTGSGIAAGIAQVMAICFCFQTGSVEEFEDIVKCFVDDALAGVGLGVRYARDGNLPDADWMSLDIRLRCLADFSLEDSVDGGSLLCRLPLETITRLFGANGFHAADSLPTVWAFFLRNPDSIESLFDVVNAGGDTDSNGAMVGALLGARNGTRIFPQHLIDGLWQREQIVDTANRLCDVLGIK